MPPCSHSSSAPLVQEVAQHRMAVLREDRLGVELHPLERAIGAGERAVAQAHDLAVVGGGSDREIVRAGLALDHERVIADHAKRLGQPGEDALLVGGDEARLLLNMIANKAFSLTFSW